MKHPHSISTHSVSRETFRRVDQLVEENGSTLNRYLDRLLWWNDRVNLVSRDVPRETLWNHIRHSLLLTQFDLFRNSDRVVDAGTGGGLPGIPLAAVSPAKKFILNDIATKKILAVKQMVNNLVLKNISVSDRSIGDFESQTPFLLLSKHAFKIDQLWEMAGNKPWTAMVFYKGMNFEKEVGAIEEPLVIESHDLGTESTDPFYQGKGLIIIKRDRSV